MTSIALGTVPGSTVQWGSVEAVAQTPNWNSWRVGANPLAWSGLKPSWPGSTTVKAQPGPGWPRLDLGTLKVMNREISLARMVTLNDYWHRPDGDPARTWTWPATASKVLAGRNGEDL